MRADITIRTLTGGDAKAWWDLRLEALETEPTSFGSSADDHRRTTLESASQRLEPGPGYGFVVGAFAGNRLVGTVGLGRARGVKEKHLATLWGVYVTPEFRGQGISGKLLREAISRARADWEIEQIVLATIADDTPARRLYLSAGFRSWGILPGALKVGSVYVDEVHMVLRLRDASEE